MIFKPVFLVEQKMPCTSYMPKMTVSQLVHVSEIFLHSGQFFLTLNLWVCDGTQSRSLVAARTGLWKELFVLIYRQAPWVLENENENHWTSIQLSIISSPSFSHNNPRTHTTLYSSHRSQPTQLQLRYWLVVTIILSSSNSLVESPHTLAHGMSRPN
jgi:hypothetical protein